MNLWALIPLISCLAFTILFVLVLQQTRRRVEKVFALFLFASGVWSFTSFMLVFNPNASSQYLIFWNGMVITAIPWVAICYYHFVRAYTNRPGGIGLYLGYAVVLAVLILCLSGYVVKSVSLVDGFLLHEIKPWDYIIAAALIPFIGFTILMLARRYRNSTDPIDRNRTMYLIVGWNALLLISYITPFTPALAGLTTDHLGQLANALIITYAISRFHLLDIKLVARRGLTYVTLLAILIGIYIGGILLGFRLFPELPVSTTVSIATVIAIFMALMARPLRHAIQGGVDRLFYRGTYIYRQELLGFNTKMGNILNLDELATAMLPALTKAISITHVFLLLQDLTSGDFSVHFTYPNDKEELSDEPRFGIDNPIIAWLEKATSPLDLRQIEYIPELKGLWQTEKGELAALDLELLCPIKSRGKLIGILALGQKQWSAFYSHEDIDLVMGIAGQAGIIIENAQLYTQATTRANTDGLTGLYNHREFHERLEQEIARGSRFGTVFSLIMLDIDIFKTYNDVYGHLAGDQILRRIGELIKGSVRKLDIPFRYGGEEFMVILPGTRLEKAINVAERVRKAIEPKARSKIMPMPVTVSLGVASWPSDGVTREEIIGCVDTALYRAKQTGRNRTCSSFDIVKPMIPLVGSQFEAQQGALNIIYALAATVDAKDHYTYGHSRKVSDYAAVLSEALGFPEDKVVNIRAAAMLHDIGKIGIPDSVLNKEGSLTEEEWEQVKTHPQDGVEILRHVINLVNCLPAILHHHERWDGKGYPHGLRGEEIPKEARIMAIADAYDAITSLRSYRERLSSRKALVEIRRCAGTQFDPELVSVFCRLMQPTMVQELETR